MLAYKKKGKVDLEEGCLDRTQVLQEAKQLFTSNNVRPKKLADVLTKCIYILLQGEKLTPNNATDLFFQITNLFQYKDITLRRLTHIGIKLLSKQADNVYFATSSLTSDINSWSDNPNIKASAIRALCHITDASTLAGIERYLKQAVIDMNPCVASAALTSSIHLLASNPDGVKRWNEIKGALNSDDPNVQYLALRLSYDLRKYDRKATSRLISDAIDQRLKSPRAICLLINIIAKFICHDDEVNKKYKDYIRNQLNHQSEIVELEAATALASIKLSGKDSKDIRAVVAHLRDFLHSSKGVLRYGAAKMLNEIAARAPHEVRECNLLLESLISQSDSNRDIAILAITTLLKTGTEHTVEKFLKQIGEFLSEIDDGFKAVVVGSIRQLCLKYPSKHQAILQFLSKMLREEGGREYKNAIVDTIKRMIEDNEAAKEEGLIHLCDFIEDCEHTSLAVKVLHFLGKEGPKTKKPSTYVRFIGNRLFLEEPSVECAAASALAKFGALDELRDDIIIALDRSSLYKDDDVRDRDVFYKNILSACDPTMTSKLIVDSKESIPSLKNLETMLLDYAEGDCVELFDINAIDDSVIAKKEAHEEDTTEEDWESPKDTAQVISELFRNVKLGNLIQSAGPLHMTDNVSEFVVDCTIYIYQNHIVLQFYCQNTVDGLNPENINIEMDEPEGLRIVSSTTCPKLVYNHQASIFVCIEIVDEEAKNERTFFTGVNMKYFYRDVGDDELSEDSYPLEDFNFVLADLL